MQLLIICSLLLATLAVAGKTPMENSSRSLDQYVETLQNRTVLVAQEITRLEKQQKVAENKDVLQQLNALLHKLQHDIANISGNRTQQRTKTKNIAAVAEDAKSAVNILGDTESTANTSEESKSFSDWAIFKRRRVASSNSAAKQPQQQQKPTGFPYQFVTSENMALQHAQLPATFPNQLLPVGAQMLPPINSASRYPAAIQQQQQFPQFTDNPTNGQKHEGTHYFVVGPTTATTFEQTRPPFVNRLFSLFRPTKSKEHTQKVSDYNTSVSTNIGSANSPLDTAINDATEMDNAENLLKKLIMQRDHLDQVIKTLKAQRQERALKSI